MQATINKQQVIVYKRQTQVNGGIGGVPKFTLAIPEVSSFNFFD